MLKRAYAAALKIGSPCVPRPDLFGQSALDFGDTRLNSFEGASDNGGYDPKDYHQADFKCDHRIERMAVPKPYMKNDPA